MSAPKCPKCGEEMEREEHDYGTAEPWGCFGCGYIEGPERALFLELSRRFKECTDPIESTRLREQLARLTFGEEE